MNTLATIRRVFDFAAIGVLLLGLLAMSHLRKENARLQTKLAESSQQLDSAKQTIAGQGKHITALVKLNADAGTDLAELQGRLETIHRNATARAVKLETVTHENQDAKTWGAVHLPGAVASVLNYADDATDAAPADRAALPAGDAVPPAEDHAADQPGASTEPDREPPSA